MPHLIRRLTECMQCTTHTYRFVGSSKGTTVYACRECDWFEINLAPCEDCLRLVKRVRLFGAYMVCVVVGISMGVLWSNGIGL
jgi:hypothetical protein